MGKIKILIADDNKSIRREIWSFLSSQYNFDVIGEAGTGIEAIGVAMEAHPDVILMDIVMPKMSGLESSQVILKKHPEIKIILLTYFFDEDYINEFSQKGISGCFTKESPLNELINAIETVISDAKYFKTPNPLAIESKRISSRFK
jgi:DNA-binding NarL/FixJ family response regulator